MNAKTARARRRAAATASAQASSPAATRRWVKPVVGLAVAALIAASLVTPKLFESSDRQAPAHSANHELGVGLAVGSPVPAFDERDLQSGEAISSSSVEGEKTLLFFSEGVMCQACFEQIKGLERMQAQLDGRGIRLVSITPDRPEDLEQAIAQYGITGPMIADDDRSMSAAFNTLGRGMHGDTPGHAFALIENGKVVWYRDYWLPPDRTMYVDPAKVLADLSGVQ